MSLNTNTWNRLRYTLYLPIYDLIADRIFRKYRKRSVELLNAKPSDTILILGPGTGKYYEEWVADFNKTMEELLAEKI